MSSSIRFLGYPTVGVTDFYFYEEFYVYSIEALLPMVQWQWRRLASIASFRVNPAHHFNGNIQKCKCKLLNAPLMQVIL